MADDAPRANRPRTLAYSSEHKFMSYIWFVEGVGLLVDSMDAFALALVDKDEVVYDFKQA